MAARDLIDWYKAPQWANYYAADKLGEAWFENMPVWNRGKGNWEDDYGRWQVKEEGKQPVLLISRYP